MKKQYTGLYELSKVYLNLSVVSLRTFVSHNLYFIKTILHNVYLF